MNQPWERYELATAKRSEGEVMDVEDMRKWKNAYYQVQSERVIEVPSPGFLERGLDLETAGGEDDGEGEPEAAVRREGCCAEGVAHGHFPADHITCQRLREMMHLPFTNLLILSSAFLKIPILFPSERFQLTLLISFVHPIAPSQQTSKQDREEERGKEKGRERNPPHPRKQLHQPTIPIRDPNDQIRFRQPPRLHIDQTQHERRQRERAQSKWCRVGNLPILHLLVETRLGLAAERGQPGGLLVGVDVGEGTVAEPRRGFGGRVFVMRHVFCDMVCVVGIVGEAAAVDVARVGGVGLGGHGTWVA